MSARLHRIHSSRDGFTPRPQLTAWQRERRDGPIRKMQAVAAASPEAWWMVLAMWLGVLAGMAGLGILVAVLS